jgi:predicted acylesterase/phospholipase RssA
LHTLAYWIDRGRIERIGGESTLGKGSLYVDGGVVDVFPAQPLIDKKSYDVVIEMNVVAK